MALVLGGTLVAAPAAHAAGPNVVIVKRSECTIKAESPDASGDALYLLSYDWLYVGFDFEPNTWIRQEAWLATTVNGKPAIEHGWGYGADDVTDDGGVTYNGFSGQTQLALNLKPGDQAQQTLTMVYFAMNGDELTRAKRATVCSVPNA